MSFEIDCRDISNENPKTLPYFTKLSDFRGSILNSCSMKNRSAPIMRRGSKISYLSPFWNGCVSFLWLDLLYSILFSYYLGEWKCLLITVSMLVLIFRFDESVVLPLIIGTRFLAFTIFYGLEKCDLYLTFIILFLELILSKVEFKINYSLPFILVVIVSNYLDFVIPCGIPDPILNRANVVTRIFVLTYLTIRSCHTKFSSIKEEEKLSRQANQLRELEEDEMRFYKRFSHFSRTCLNGIVNFVGFLRGKYESFLTLPSNDEGKGRDQLMSCLDTVEISSSEIFRQTTELVEYFELTKGKAGPSVNDDIKPSKEITDIDEVLDYVFRVQSKMRLETDRKKQARVKWIVNTSRNKPDESRSYPRFIRFCPQHFSRILMNITSNGLKYTERGSVKVDLTTRNSKLIITVKDTGIGIDKYLLDRIFVPFVKNDTGKQSFSIGMVITKSIVDRAGGSIRVHSEGKDKGAEVRITIPCEEPREEEIKRYKNNFVYYSDDGNDEENRRRKDRVDDDDNVFQDVSDVLIVEDNLINQKVLKKHVSMIVNRNRADGEKARIHVASDGVEGLSLLSSLSHRDPLVLTDIDMPRMDGFEFVKRVRERFEYGERFVVYAVTVTIVGDKSLFCSRHGFDGVESKPVYFSRMVNLLRFMAEERKKRIELEKEKMIANRNLSVLGSRKKRSSIIISQTKHVSIGNDDVGKVKANIINILAFLVITCVNYFQPFAPIPDEYRSGWVLMIQTVFTLHVVLYISWYLLRFSTDIFAVMSLSIHLIGLTIGTEFSFLGRLQIQYMCEFTFIMQANQSIESFPVSFIFSMLFYLRSVYYELVRPSEYFSTLQDDPFLYISPKFCLTFFVISVLTMSHSFVIMREGRGKRWERVIGNMMKIEKDYNLTSSKVSHDLATPASALVIYLDETKRFLKQKGFLSVRNVKKYQSKILDYYVLLLRCSFELELSIQNFLTCCKIRNGMVVTKLIPDVYFSSFIQSIVDRYRFLLKRTKTELVCRIDPRLNSERPLFVDMTNVHLIVSNLLFNSICHSKTATKIEVSCRIISTEENLDDEGLMEISILDNGVGMKSKFLKKFNTSEEFDDSQKLRFRERFSNTLGLGLIVCRYLTSMMKSPSRVVITSHVGTKATFQFPFKICNPREKSQEEECEGEIEEEEEEEETEDIISTRVTLRDHDIRKLRVLCVEDVAMLGNFLKVFLIKIGFCRDRVFVENHENEAIRAMNNCENFDLLITDLNLVNMQFPEMLSKVRRERIPKLVLCATGSPEGIFSERNKEFLRRKKVRVHGVVQKPIIFDSLRNSLRRFVDVQ